MSEETVVPCPPIQYTSQSEAKDYWRYEFAGRAMQGALSNDATTNATATMAHRNSALRVTSLAAAAAVEYADALLAELEKETPK